MRYIFFFSLLVDFLTRFHEKKTQHSHRTEQQHLLRKTLANVRITINVSFANGPQKIAVARSKFRQEPWQTLCFVACTEQPVPVPEENSRRKKPRGKRVYSICWLIGTACKHRSVPKACLLVYTLLIRMVEYTGVVQYEATTRPVHSGSNMWQACLTHVAFVLQIMFTLSLHLCGSNRRGIGTMRSQWPNSLGKTRSQFAFRVRLISLIFGSVFRPTIIWGTNVLSPGIANCWIGESRMFLECVFR